MSTVSRNVLWSSIISILQIYTGSIVFIVLAKLMSVDDFGILSFGFSLASILVVCADFGFSLMIMKDYPAVDSNPIMYISNSIILKSIISLLILIATFIYLLHFFEGKWILVGGLFTVFAIISSFILYFQSLMKLQNKFEKHTETIIIYAICITATIFIYWFLNMSLEYLVLGIIVSRIIQLFYSLFICRHCFSLNSINFGYQNKLAKGMWSFGLHTVIGIFYFMVDTQIISIFLDAKAVALYQSVFRIILVLLIVSEMLSNVLLPYLSFKYFNKKDIDLLISKLFLFLVIIGCALFLFFTSFSKSIILFLYSKEYLLALPVVIPLSVVLILRTSSSLLGNILTISNKQVYRVKTVFTSLIVSLILNLALIPQYGIIAAAWVSVVVHLCMFAMYLYYSKKEVAGAHFFSKDLIIILSVTAILFFVVQWFSYIQPIIVNLMAIIMWLVCLYFVMMRNDNFVFLRNLMNDKGV